MDVERWATRVEVVGAVCVGVQAQLMARDDEAVALRAWKGEVVGVRESGVFISRAQAYK